MMDAEQRRRAYVAQLESVIKQMLVPMKNVPFNLAIEAMTGYRVIEFKPSSGEHRKILEKIVLAASAAASAINIEGIVSRRANEVGNKIEPYVKDALNQVGDVVADTPKTKSGRRKSAGYPDIEAMILRQPCYIECKTFNIENEATTQRSFYFSPTEEFKVTHDAFHFLLAFEIIDAGIGSKGLRRYKSNGFKLISLESLKLDVKHEFNSDNRRLYSGHDGTQVLYATTGLL